MWLGGTPGRAALELRIDAGEQRRDAADSIAERLRRSGHAKDARGRGAPHETGITGKTVIGWLEGCRRGENNSARNVMWRQFEFAIALAPGEEPEGRAEVILQFLENDPNFASLRER